jgi:diguanylate cyclase (GGDEF)-like protein
MGILDLLLSYAISNAICAIVISSLWRRSRRRSDGLGFWLAAFVIQLLAVLIGALRGRVPDLVPVVIGNTLFIGATLVLYVGLERYVGKTSSQRYNCVLLAVFILVHGYFTFTQPSLLARSLTFSLALLAICSQCAWLMLRRVDAAMRPVTKMVGVTFAAYGLLSISRIFVDLAAPPASGFFESGVHDVLGILAYQNLSIALTFALFLMVNRRLVAALEGDIRERKGTELELRYLGTHDALTGLYDRGFFEEELARLERGRRFPVSIVMADVDSLKEINDREGHAAGDEVLKRVARIMTGAFRAEDLIARIGGDEFAGLLPGTDAKAAEIALRRVRSMLQEHNAAQAGTPLCLSFGMSTAEERASLTAVLKRADENMYLEKQARAVP